MNTKNDFGKENEWEKDNEPLFCPKCGIKTKHRAIGFLDGCEHPICKNCHKNLYKKGDEE